MTSPIYYNNNESKPSAQYARHAKSAALPCPHIAYGRDVLLLTCVVLSERRRLEYLAGADPGGEEHRAHPPPPPPPACVLIHAALAALLPFSAERSLRLYLRHRPRALTDYIPATVPSDCVHLARTAAFRGLVHPWLAFARV